MRSRKSSETRKDQPLKLYEWFFKKCDVIQILGCDTGGFQKKLNGTVWKIIVVLLPGEAALFGRCDQLAVLNDGRPRPVGVTGNPKSVKIKNVGRVFSTAPE